MITNKIFFVCVFFLFGSSSFAKNNIVLPKKQDVSEKVYDFLKNETYKDVLLVKKVNDCRGNLDVIFSLVYKEKDFLVINKNTAIECKTMPYPSLDVKNFVLDAKSGKNVDFKVSLRLLDDKNNLKSDVWKFLKNELLNREPEIDSQCFDLIDEKEVLKSKDFVVYPKLNGKEVAFLFDGDKINSMCFEEIIVKKDVLLKNLK